MSKDSKKKISEQSAPVAEASAPVAEASAPVAEASAPVDPLVDLDKRIAALKAEIAKAIENDDFGAQRDLAANAAMLRAQRVDIALGKSIEEFIPEMLGMIDGAPEGKFLLLVTFEGGKAVSAVRRAMVETAHRAALSSAETKAVAGAKAPVRANFTAQVAGVSGDPNRHAPAGWTSTYTTKGETWRVKSLGNGSYEFQCGDRCLSGVGNAVVKQLSGHGPNIYAALKLPLTPGDSFLANPPKAWTPPA